MDTFGKWKRKDVNSRTFDSGSQAWIKPGLPRMRDEEHRCHLRKCSLAHLTDVEALRVFEDPEEQGGEAR